MMNVFIQMYERGGRKEGKGRKKEKKKKKKKKGELAEGERGILKQL